MEWKIKTQVGEILIRKAHADEESIVIGIKQEAARWLETKNINQWAGFLMSPGEDMVHKNVPGGEVFLAFKDKEPVATITIFWQDPVCWGEKGRDGIAGYLHGLAIWRQYAGKALGRDILFWAMEQIQKKGKKVRLDCMAENKRINQYYKDLGFMFSGPAILSNGFKVNLYEIS